jgi:hypothetical protein
MLLFPLSDLLQEDGSFPLLGEERIFIAWDE